MDLTKFDGHTPGPWHECYHNGRRWIETAGDVAVAQIIRTGIRSETAANSALIKAAPELLAEVRRLTDEAAAMRRERDELAAQLECIRLAAEDVMREGDRMAARLSEIEAQEPVAWVPMHPREGALWSMTTATPSEERLPSHYPLSPLYTSPAPAAAPEQAEPAELLRAVLNTEIARGTLHKLRDGQGTDTPGGRSWLAAFAWAGESPERSDGCGACGDSCRSRGSCRLADESPRPADPLTPPPGCRLLGDNEPAQAGDMAYIGSIGGRWRPVRPRMGIIGATMDELSDGARVLALARPCLSNIDGCSERPLYARPVPAQAAPERAEPGTKAARDVLAERRRQVEVEGWTPGHDDEHSNGCMGIAAACYALADVGSRVVNAGWLWRWTGWDDSRFKPYDRRINLVRAAALLLAEIERLDRTSAPEQNAAGCGACGDACLSRGSCRLADESPNPAARPCRCGPDCCGDSTSRQKGGAT